MEMVPLPRRMLISFWQCLFLSSTNLAESMILFDRQVKKCFWRCFWMCLTTNSLLVNKFPCWKDQSRIFVKFCFMSCFVLWSKPSWWEAEATPEVGVRWAWCCPQGQRCSCVLKHPAALPSLIAFRERNGTASFLSHQAYALLRCEHSAPALN